MTHVISFINLKGGVGKTTTAVAIAEFIAKEHKKKVLLIDLDPQTNATVSLIREEHWMKMDNQGQTIAQLFKDHLTPDEEPTFDIQNAIVKCVSTIDGGIEGLDLLPSSIRLIEIQDQIPLIAITGNYTANPLDIIKKALKPVLDQYDYVLIDCPPSLGTVTKNGLRISTGYIIPTIPDILSTWGIMQIVNIVSRFSRETGQIIVPLGIIATKVRMTTNLHKRIVDELQDGNLGTFARQGKSAVAQPPLFQDLIPLRTAIAGAADVEINPRTFKRKYGDVLEIYDNLAKEIMVRCQQMPSW